MIGADIQILMPEIVLAVFAMGALLAAVYTTKDGMAPLLTWATSGLLVLLAVWIGINGQGTNIAFGGMFVASVWIWNLLVSKYANFKRLLNHCLVSREPERFGRTLSNKLAIVYCLTTRRQGLRCIP